MATFAPTKTSIKQTNKQTKKLRNFRCTPVKKTHTTLPNMSQSHLDEKIRGEVWDSKVPIMFTLASAEIGTLEPPLPYYVSTAHNFLFVLVFFSFFVFESA
jgi:hypothetical protein